MSTSKTCAICFSGQVRFAERENVKQNIQQNLIEPLKTENYNVHFFAAVEKEYHNFDWSGFQVVPDQNYWDEDLNIYNKRLGPGVTGGSFNVMNQWKKCQEAGLLKKQYEEKHGIVFDLVVRIRPDIILHEKIDLNTIKPECFNIPNHDNWFGYNDRLCIGSSNNMDYYMINFVDNIKHYFLNEKVVFHSETLLKHHLDKTNVKIHRPNFTIRFEREKGTDYGNIIFN